MFTFAGHPRYVAGMDRLTPEQVRKVHDAIGPAVGYLWRLVGRLVQVGLDTRDPRLMRLAREARDALHAPSGELHYPSCARGVGRAPAGT